ncbi:hypothetical protein [Psychrobacillus vulpis]|uniref:Uncharacterized protein n=1 Tax=Psychrobacillus vulpis TaxID=2325572 RepID=A0A544TPW7_9BACI|nr:hypothetical protein [Psychrobacillus vulpis]TQR19504.1 hypothetical protein FG384_12740 [Psychrobacillus vulpis]
MAKSAAKRKREHELRNTGKDVSMLRNDVDFSTHVRMTKTKKEKLDQQHRKYKKHFAKGIVPDGNAFYLYFFWLKLNINSVSFQ